MKQIVQDGAEVLNEVAKPVPEEMFGTAELARLIKDMGEALDTQPEGVALAAPQIGVSWRIFIVRVDRTVPLPDVAENKAPPRPEIAIYINPEIIKTSQKRVECDEGCLSVRGVYGTTKRHEKVTVRARRADGSRFQRGGSGLMAQIFEHETDHLNGILFVEKAKHLVEVVPEHEQS
jgi:peptide deformylase